MRFSFSQRKAGETILTALGLMFVLAGCGLLQPKVPVSALKVGDFIQFGRYDGKPILWRVIEDSANPTAEIGNIVTGDPLLLSDQVITNKPFDAAGPHGHVGIRIEYGSNLWIDSSYRAWLKSDAGAGKIEWPNGIAPVEANVTENAYADEAGFLSTENFTIDEFNMIKPILHKSLLDGIDYLLADGGTIGYVYADTVELLSFYDNYDEAYFIMVTDKVFLLDPVKLDSLSNRFGEYYSTTLSYWIGAPDASIYTDSSPANELYVREDGVIMYEKANKGDVGVRPALVLDRETFYFLRGDGTLLEPFVIVSD